MNLAVKKSKKTQAKKIKTTVRLPDELRQEFLMDLVEKKYGMRDKSKWVEEAIHLLLSLDDYHKLVELSEDMSGFVHPEAFYFSPEVKDMLDDACAEVRRHHPMIHGVQSAIVRTSILQRLLR